MFLKIAFLVFSVFVLGIGAYIFETSDGNVYKAIVGAQLFMAGLFATFGALLFLGILP